MQLTHFMHRPSPAESTVVDNLDQTLWLSNHVTNKAASRLIHMNLSSVQGFHALADMGGIPGLEAVAPHVCWQRLRQCRDLYRVAGRKQAFRPIPHDPVAAESRRMWWMARNCLAQGKVRRAVEQVEMAELILEHAYRAAAATERNRLVLALYQEHIHEIETARRQFASDVALFDD
ncbi:MAG: hypothetical protein AB7O62_24475 [Pirellulales bacterium]